MSNYFIKSAKLCHPTYESIEGFHFGMRMKIRIMPQNEAGENLTKTDYPRMVALAKGKLMLPGMDINANNVT